jgi:hypothetical protein
MIRQWQRRIAAAQNLNLLARIIHGAS